MQLKHKTVFHTLDALRGLLAIMIVTRHAPIYFQPISLQQIYLAVDIFFLLSGVVLCQAYEDKLKDKLSFKDFILLRAVRIYPLYILGSLLGLYFLISSGKGEDLSVLQWASIGICGVLLLPNFATPGIFMLNGPAWSLFLEMFANIFYGLFARHLSDKRVLIVIGLSILGLIFAVFARNDHNIDFGFWDVSVPFGIFRVMAPFFTGVFLFRMYSRSNRVPKEGINANVFSVAITFTCCALMVLSPAETLRPFYDLACVLVVFPFLIFTSLWFQPSGYLAKICSFLGLTSYAIYTLHSPLAKVLNQEISKFGFDIAGKAPLSGLVLLVVVISLAFVLDKIYDAPVRKYLIRKMKLQHGRFVGANIAKTPVIEAA